MTFGLRAVFRFLTGRCNVSGPQKHPADFIVTGIGNIGAKFEGTRHNIGFMVVERISAKLENISSLKVLESSASAGILAGGKSVVLATPVTFVNESGRAVRELISVTGCDASCCMVVVDDFNLKLGKIRIRRNGSDGGHNGLKSIISEIGSEFPRLRVGIGPLPHGVSSVEFVLGRFSNDEMVKVKEITEKAADAIECFFSSGIEAAMNRFNKIE